MGEGGGVLGWGGGGVNSGKEKIEDISRSRKHYDIQHLHR
jgi:hypothetical protein